MGKKIELKLNRATDDGKSLAEILKERNIPLDSPCGGMGKCGKCKVRIKKAGGEDISIEVLACQTETGRLHELLGLDKDEALRDEIIGIEISDESLVREDMEVETLDEGSLYTGPFHPGRAIAIDIGTTTIAAALIGEDGRVSARDGLVNSQRALGSDVISRIEASLQGKGPELAELVRDDIRNLLLKLAGEDGLSLKKYISGNTAMLKLLKGEDVMGLARAPYEGRSQLEYLDGEDMGLGEGEVILLPGIGPFVGSDVLMGILKVDLMKGDKVAFIDLGTNGEMALYTGEELLVASTAAGPALEGGGISCGVPAYPGAIWDVEISGNVSAVKTIMEKEPLGLCGSGVISTVSQLLKNGIIDRRGNFDEEFSEEGYPVSPGIFFTQEDVRKVQTAKAAISAGLNVLLMNGGVEAGELKKLYIAGGFGAHIRIEDAARIGLIPGDLEEKAELAGNTSLKGAIGFARCEIDVNKLERVRKDAQVIELAGNPLFQEEYIKRIDF